MSLAKDEGNGRENGGPHERAKEDGVQLGHQIKDRKKMHKIKGKSRMGGSKESCQGHVVKNKKGNGTIEKSVFYSPQSFLMAPE